MNETTVVEEEDEEVESIIHSGMEDSTSCDRRGGDTVDYPRARRDYRRVRGKSITFERRERAEQTVQAHVT